jgi:hypothetical protein
MTHWLTSGRWRQLGRLLVLAFGAAYVAVYAGIALLRMRYPFELEWMEGGMVDHVGRIVAGRPLYAKPSLEFVSYLYPPLYDYAAAAVSSAVGTGFFPLRLLSFVSSLGVFALLFELARRETGALAPGVSASGLYAALFDRAGGWFDLARLDSFYLFVLLAGVFAMRHARGRGGAALAGVLLGAACLTKQSALVVVIPLIAYQVYDDPRRAGFLTAAIAVLAGGGIALLQAVSDRWFWYYCVTLPAHHPRIPGGVIAFWSRDLLPSLPLALLLALFFVGTRFRSDTGRTRLFFPALALGMLLSSWSVRNVVGAEVNNLLPVFAAVAMLAALGWHQARRFGPAALLAADVVLLGQLALLAYDPSRHLPSPADREAGTSLVARIASIPGEVFVPHHGYLARLAGKRGFAHTLAMDNVFLDDRGPAGRDLADELTHALAERRFSAVLIESDGRYSKSILQSYQISERLFDRPDVFWPVTGGRLRPEYLAIPR